MKNENLYYFFSRKYDQQSEVWYQNGGFKAIQLWSRFSPEKHGFLKGSKFQSAVPLVSKSNERTINSTSEWTWIEYRQIKEVSMYVARREQSENPNNSTLPFMTSETSILHEDKKFY